MATLSLYEKDFYAWTEEQARLIQEKSFDKLDLVHLQEELQIMGASEKRELVHRLEVLLMHLLKYKYQSAKRTKSWINTIKVQRSELKYHLKDNPSLTNPDRLQDAFVHAYSVAILKAAIETKLDNEVFPVKCEWTIKQILNDEFFPE